MLVWITTAEEAQKLETAERLNLLVTILNLCNTEELKESTAILTKETLGVAQLTRILGEKNLMQNQSNIVNYLHNYKKH